MSKIYLDYASLTPIDKGVMMIMKKYLKGEYTNPSSLYASGVKAKRAIDEAKTDIAKLIHAHPDELVFTSGGTEANDLVFRMCQGKKVMISAIEHSSIIENKNAILIPVDKNGIVDLDFIKENLNPEISLVSIMYVNNEIGSIQPINEIAKIIRDYNKKNNTNILFHTDASQAVSLMPIFVEKLSVDLMTFDGHKIYGPRGIGMLYVKRGIEIKRRGTENVPAIMGFSYALAITEKIKEKENKRISEIKGFFYKGLQEINPQIKINGSLENSTPHILNVSIPNIDNEFFLLQLDVKGVEVSTKSACLRDEDESYVLKAICTDSKNSIRFSFGRDTSMGDIKYTLKVISKLLNK